MNDIIISESVNHWLKTGERGTSSETIVEVMTGLNLTQDMRSHPHDPSDFKRCVLLLAYVPEFKPRMYEMSAESKQWAALVEQWDELEDMLMAEIATGSCPTLYAEMKRLGC